MAFQYKREMNDKETVRELLSQELDEGWKNGLFIGVAPFKLMEKLNLFYMFEIKSGDKVIPSCLTQIRIYNHGSIAIYEIGYRVTPDYKITDARGVIHEPEKLLNLKAAPSGWEISMMTKDVTEILTKWLQDHKDDR